MDNSIQIGNFIQSAYQAPGPCRSDTGANSLQCIQSETLYKEGRSASSSCARRVQHDSPHMGCVKSWQCDPGCTECLSGPRAARRSRSQAHTNLRHVLRAGALCVARRWRGWRCCRWWRCCETCSPSTPSASPPPRSWRRPCPRRSRPSATMRPSCCTCARPAPLPPALPHQPRARPLMWHPCVETLLLSCVYALVLH